MKNKIYLIIALTGCLSILISCDKEIDSLKPHNAITQESLLSNKDGIKLVTSTNYANFMSAFGTTAGSQTFNVSGSSTGGSLMEGMVYLNEGLSNNVNVTDLGLDYGGSIFYYQTNVKDNGIANGVWQVGYAMIRSCNNVLDAIEKQPAKTTDSDLKQYKGDNLFIRAYVYYNLAQFFCRPYYDNPTTNLGLPLKLTSDNSVIIERGSVKELYDQIIADLTAAVAVLPDIASPNRNLANKYACYGLLSRVYRDMGGSFSQPNNAFNQLAVDNASKILGGTWGGYIPGNDKSDAYIKGMFGVKPTKNNPEYLWCFDATIMTTNYGNNVTRIYGSDENNMMATGSNFLLSPDLVSLFDKAKDRRFKYFIAPDPLAYYHTAPWDSDTYTTTKFITGKYSGTFDLFGDPTPNPQIRIAEIYLNRAEAYVKLGKSTEALADLNYIRERAGLLPLTGLSGQSLFLEILNERRRELIGESLTGLDYYRNGLPMTRNYSSGFPDRDITTIQPNDSRVIFPIPEFEVNVFSVKQNPGY
ncbi:MAG: RagB/SusD family nutrient uptake outer membrane protein [Bacteroidales bacterium]